MIAWLKKIFRRQPRLKAHTVFWSTRRVCDYGELGVVVFVTPHSETYEAENIQQALAMHRSDHPGTVPQSVLYLD